jgi:hypothetical protein
MNAFDHMLRSLANFSEPNPTRTVDAAEYEKFCKEFLFSTLRNESLGMAFCKQFGIKDCVLEIVNDDTARLHIKSHYIET